MQTLWNRVALAGRSCRCPQCIPSAHGVSRRATSSATQRVSRYLSTGTALYTSVFAAALTYDAGVKQERREQWDRAIATTKQELAQFTGVEDTQLLGEREATAEDEELSPSDVEADVFRNIDERMGKPRWPTNTGPPLQIQNVPPQSIYATAEFKGRAQRLHWTAKKLELTHLSLDIFQLRAMLLMHKNKWRMQAAKAVPPEYGHLFMRPEADLRERLVHLRSVQRLVRKANATLSDYEPDLTVEHICNFSQDELADFVVDTKRLNRKLLSLFRMHADHSIETPTLLGSILYNLSVTSARPDVNTFNTLLQGFSAAREPALSRMVIGALRGAHVRPNEVTLAAVLRHYTDTGECDNFVWWVGLLRGRENGLSLARADIPISEVSQGRLVRRPDCPEKIIQLPYATPLVFGEVMRGVVRYGSLEMALKIAHGMRDQGWGLCMAGMTPLLRDCADRADWAAGMAVWQQIQTLKTRSRRSEGGGFVSERIGLPTFAAMLRLCFNCDRQETHRKVVHMAIRSHGDETHVKLPKLIDAQNAEMESIKAARRRSRLSQQSPSQAFESRHPTCSEGQENTAEDDFESMPAVQLDEEQLHGLLPAAPELGEYELRERPMSLLHA